MAKRGEPETGDEYEFTPPDFDEDAFIHRELTGFRTTLVLVLWGVVSGLIAWLVYAAMGGGDRGWAVSLTVAILAGFALKWLFPKLGADVSHYGRKEWVGTAFLFFFTWLAVFIIVLNPPVDDHAEPHVALYLSPPEQQHLGDVDVHVFAVDNGEVEDFSFTLVRGNQTLASAGELERLDGGHYRYRAQNLTGGTYTVQVVATDASGHTTRLSQTLNVSRQTVTYEPPGGEALADTDDHVRFSLAGDIQPCQWNGRSQTFRPQPCIRHAYLALESGGQVQLQYDADNRQWAANKNHPGWTPGSQTFTFHAVPADQFHGKARVEGNEIVAGPYTVDVTAPQLGGKEIDPPRPDPAAAPMREVPAAGPIAAVLVLLGAALLVRRR